jgi:5,10-methylenetetrahydromethanopterin reductase
MAEAFGLSSIWFAEPAMERGVAPALGACAMATTRIELGIGVWNPFMRHPAQIAMDVVSLDEMSGGRLTLGLGAGLARPIARPGIDNAQTRAALSDGVAIVRGLLGGAALTYKGEAFSIEDTRLSFKPLRADMPILMAACGPDALTLAGEIADGLIVDGLRPAAFTAHAASVARPRRLVHFAPCAVGTDRAAAMAVMKPILAALLRQHWQDTQVASRPRRSQRYPGRRLRSRNHLQRPGRALFRGLYRDRRCRRLPPPRRLLSRCWRDRSCGHFRGARPDP